MKKIGELCIGLIIFVLIFFGNNVYIVKGEIEETKNIIYFFSSTCSSCAKTTEYINKLENDEKCVVIKYNISTRGNKKIFNEYCDNYDVREEDRYVPLVFVSNKYLNGKQTIFEQLEKELLNQNNEKTLLLNGDNGNYNEDVKSFNSMQWISVFIAGIVNGFNPCSLAMFIFLLSICFVNKNKVMKIAGVYILGKFVTFLLLGTLLYNVLTYVNYGAISKIIKIVSIVMVLLLVVYNLLDFIESKNNRYNNIRLQLPLRVRKFNHTIIKKINNLMEKKYLLIAVFIISVAVSLGEFMCTGQIYLMTLVTVIQYFNQFNAKAIFLLVIYNIAMIIPIFVISLIINKGKSIFQMSEFVRENMPKIKIINCIILLGIAIFIIIS